MGEFSYTAYGELLTASSHAPHPDPRLGHKGLFLDRLDTGVVDPLTGAEIARHVLGAKHTYFMVNRSYDPQLGRFLQRDPNATGLPVLMASNYAGDLAHPGVDGLELELHIHDGVGITAYVDSNPWTRSDPFGMFFSAIDLLGASTTTTGLQTDWSVEVVDAGLTGMEMVFSVFANYAFEQFLDFAWSNDWDEADDLYSKSAGAAMGTGSWAMPDEASASSGSPVMAIGVSDLLGSGKMTAGAKGIGVYLVLDANGKPIYAGRSKNLQKRMTASQKRLGGRHVVGIATGTYEASRGLEQMLINHYDLKNTGHNKTNAVSGKKNKKKKFDNYMRAARMFLMGLAG